jgi:hypothetical protein
MCGGLFNGSAVGLWRALVDWDVDIWGGEFMELLDRYLQAVRFWLPKAQQEDIIAELSSDLRSQIDDREMELGRPLDDAELEVILRRCGSPILVASRYRPQTQLIGPALFPIYLFVLKMVLLWILVPVFVLIVGPAMVFSAPNHWGALLQTWSTLWFAMFVSAGTITLVFAVIERTGAELKLFEKWELRSLPLTPKAEQPLSRTQTIFELVCGIVGLLWMLAVPYYPFLILGPAAAFLKLAPMWHAFYLPLLLLCLAGLARQCVSLMRPQWTWLPPAAQLANSALALILLHFILNMAVKTPNGDWHPFVVLADHVANPARAAVVAAIVNASVLLGMGGVWIGLSIAACIQTWQLLRKLRQQASSGCGALLPRMM